MQKLGPGLIKLVILLAFSILGNSFASSNTSELGASLNFPPSLNKFRILNQKLEFHLIDENSLRLGHQLLSNSGMKLEIIKSGSSDILRFTGPKQFMKSSQIILRDPSGKAIWKKEVAGLKMQTKKLPSPQPEIRNDIRIYEESDDVDSLLSLASESVFFNFCLFHENETRRFNICSSDYNASKDGDHWQLKSVKSTEKENRFIVNGVEVGSEGEIQFSKEITNLSLTAKLVSGLLVEVKTREVPLVLKDYEYQVGKPELTLKVRENSSDPLAEETREWQSKIQLAKPFFYIEAENQISLKQEIVIEGDLLADSERPRVLFPQNKTYDSVLELDFEKKSTNNFRPLKKTDSIKIEGDQAIWSMRNLKVNKINVNQIELQKPGAKHPFIGSYQGFPRK